MMSDREVIEGEFRARGIDPSNPGFYDQEEFKRHEATCPSYLERYAEYVRMQQCPRDYSKRVRRVVRAAATFMLTRLQRDHATGRCIDASLVLGRFLERLRIWNYVEHGGLTVAFPPGARIPTTHFAPLMVRGNPAMTGHAWIVAPPFKVIDATVLMQPYLPGEHRFLPEFVMAEEVEDGQPAANDIMEPEGVRWFVETYGRDPTLADVEAIAPGALDRVHRLGVKRVRHHGTTLTYVPVAVTAHDGPLETARSLCVGGKYPMALFEEFVSEYGFAT